MVIANINLKKQIFQKKAVKVIAGLSNFDINQILKVAQAAEIGGANYIDVAADPDIICIVKSIVNLPICVSSINPVNLLNCILAGADMVEIGNFDFFYNKQISFSKIQIIQLVQEVQSLLSNVCISVTIPHILLLNEQIDLALHLQSLGVDILQTEGISSKNKFLSIVKQNISCSTLKASAALSSTYAIANAVEIPVIASSGINALSAPIAISYGASGVGLGSSLGKHKTISEMAKYISEIVHSVNHANYDISSRKLWTIALGSNTRVRSNTY